MSHSTKEFVLDVSWFECFADACSARTPLFRKGNSSALSTSGGDAVSVLLRSSEPAPSALMRQIDRSLQMSEGSILGYIEQLNCRIGQHFKHRHGYRDHPLLVLSKYHPWSSFFSPITDAKSYLRDRLSDIFHLRRDRSLPVDVVIGAVAMLLIICHPFSDCNGRTTRLLLYAMLTRYMGISTGAAVFYANRFTGSDGQFVLAFWEIRENKKFDLVIDLFS